MQFVGRLCVLLGKWPSEVLSRPREDIDLMRAYFSVVPEPDGYLEAALIRDALFVAMCGSKSDPSKHYFRFKSEKENQQEFINFLEY